MSLSEHWTEFMKKMTICARVLAELDIYILLAVHCDISVSAYYIDKVTTLITFPVLTYLVEIQEETLIQ